MKARTRRRINTSFRGRRVLRRVTLGQHAYRHDPRQRGPGKIFLSRLSMRYAVGRAPLRVNVFVTVLDQDGRQQTLRRTFRLKVRR